MNLDTLIDGLAQRRSGPDGEVLDLTCDSREVRPGWAFIALKGEKTDGAAFVPQALAQGACAVISESPLELPAGIAACTFLADPRLRMAEMARRMHGTPDERLALLGVTGTNGKTTTTTLIRQLLRGAGIGCGLVGTVLNAAGDQEEEAIRTTPESPTFYRWLRRSVEAGDAASAVEVSSHALCLGRVHAALFKVGVFTNLTQDHLDYHITLEAYFEAKALLRNQCGRFLVNADDPFGRRLLEGGRCWSYAIDREADYRMTDLVLGPTGTRFHLHALQGEFEVESPLLGRFNAYNLLAALAACAEAGFDLNRLIPAVPRVTGAPGRLERVDCGQPFGVMVDYAHTPDALEKLLTEGRRLLPPGGRLHVLFGCGGDRDRAKRPLMAAAVAAGADVLWHTSDNPRTEDPERILDDAAPGIPEALRADGTRYHRNADRRAAVAQALADCRPGDLLLLAGKGHEPYQEIHGVKHPYSDRNAVEAVLGASR
ncbi:UDP-N-acetylmuramoyl-L-alanyl-D-glutamate--2,6-diaminopimelate ligase [Geothrix limicola]|uniref:UDP-N-acetylmuramoyl-L-alanyl-D-glutamate--2,6-diaminopimelate ligase n=1 Tax=Geothrix limicola TaxID=2927978 RepID=A0ABQ5QCW6_9BACT|nr:UDP-N-acetylmuramoyl-L-alanyl-D-glutamate--2,6-diaminopimelate ligase [Geothrix limicola]GLH71975.1 UDP-N-acetylmuramoyl-L-alanyl-D-glutamate--2,6-diaminopimelate ligase [Geothrix limicola]